MANLRMESSPSWAVTINLNPLSYVTIPVHGKKLRKKWADHAQCDQRFFLLTFCLLLQRQQVQPHDMDYAFELTEKGCVHMHIKVICPRVVLDSAKEDFCLTVRPRMPEAIKDRLVFIKPMEDSGWTSYIHKEDDPDLDDVPIEVPKDNLFIRRHVKD